MNSISISVNDKHSNGKPFFPEFFNQLLVNDLINSHVENKNRFQGSEHQSKLTQSFFLIKLGMCSIQE